MANKVYKLASLSPRYQNSSSYKTLGYQSPTLTSPSSCLPCGFKESTFSDDEHSQQEIHGDARLQLLLNLSMPAGRETSLYNALVDCIGLALFRTSSTLLPCLPLGSRNESSLLYRIPVELVIVLRSLRQRYFMLNETFKDVLIRSKHCSRISKCLSVQLERTYLLTLRGRVLLLALDQILHDS